MDRRPSYTKLVTGDMNSDVVEALLDVKGVSI